MKNLTRILSALLIASMAFGLVACGGDDEEDKTENKTVDLGDTDESTGDGFGTDTDTGEDATTDPGLSDFDPDEIPDNEVNDPDLKNGFVFDSDKVTIGIAGKPAEENCFSLILKKADVYSGSLVLVNAAHKLETEPELTNVFGNRGKVELAELDANGKTQYANTYKMSGDGIELEETALAALNALTQKYYELYKNNYLLLTEGYRDSETQGAIFYNAVKLYGAEEAGKYALKADNSDYRTGLSLYLKYMPADGLTYTLNDAKADEAEQFLDDYAADYGLIRRYPADKADYTGIGTKNHYQYRYVGVPHALIMSEGNYSLEEYIAGIKYYTESNRMAVTVGTSTYHIYYVPASAEGNDVTVHIPKNKNYTVSGNNVDGYIVTIDMTASN